MHNEGACSAPKYGGDAYDDRRRYKWTCRYGTGLDRERIIAKAGFNRWLVPPAALCIHLCIGMAYGFSVFWLPLSRALGVTAPRPVPTCRSSQELFTTTCDWRVSSMGWMYTLFLSCSACPRAVWGGWLERVGSRKAGVVAAIRRGGGLDPRRHRHLRSPILADVARLRGDRRDRSWPWLHLPGFDAGEVVSGPARHGDGHGDHGVRRRRDDRCTARQPADEPLQDILLRRCLADFPDDGGNLFLLHDRRRVPLPAAADGLATRWLDAAERTKQIDDHPASGASAGRAQDAAILAHLVGAVFERVGGHRRDRDGLADASGNLWR